MLWRALKMPIFVLLCPILLALGPSIAVAANDCERLNILAQYENFANPNYPADRMATLKSPDPIELFHFEIPLRAIEQAVSDRMPPEVLNALIFEKEGQKYLRWPIHPSEIRAARNHDQPSYFDIERFLISKGLDAKKYSYFKAFTTSSRSLLVYDPKCEAAFSVKVGTNYLHDQLVLMKRHSWKTANGEAKFYEYLDRRMKHMRPQFYDYQDEPAAFGIKDFDAGMSIRLLSLHGGGKPFLVPGFSVLDEYQGPKLAKASGYSDPMKFFLDVISQVGKASAEKLALTGVASDSLHMQNFSLEVDENLKWTKRIITRDEGDAYLWRQYFQEAGEEEVSRVGLWNYAWNFEISMYAPFRFVKATPTWFTDQVIHNSPKVYPEFATNFYATFKKLLNLPNDVRSRDFSDNRWTPADVWKTQEAQEYFKAVRENSLKQFMCNRVLSN